MEKVIKILMNRDGIDYDTAKSLCEETIEEMITNPLEADDIIGDYLGLEPDYIFDLVG